MRKFLLATLSILSMSCLALGVGCSISGISESSIDSSSSEVVPKSEIALLNGFNRYQDVAVIYLDPATFDGSMKLNEDATYIAEG